MFAICACWACDHELDQQDGKARMRAFPLKSTRNEEKTDRTTFSFYLRQSCCLHIQLMALVAHTSHRLCCSWATWKMKAAKDRGEDFMTRNAKTTFWEEKNATGIVGRARQRRNRVVFVGPRALWSCGGSVLEWLAQASSKVCEKPIWEGVWPCWDQWDSVCSRTASVEWNVPGKYGPHGELFFFHD